MIKSRSRRSYVIIISLFLAMIVLAMFCLSVGSVGIPMKDVFRSLIGQNLGSSDLILLNFRLPRILAAILIGAALAVSGTLLQG